MLHARLSTIAVIGGGHAALGEDWRDTLAALRPYTPTLWCRLSRRERE
jgi:hypothetical protein